VSLEVLLVNVVWAAAMQWLLKNPHDPAWLKTALLIKAMGGLPE